MTKFSDFIRAPGTAGPPTREGISALGFVLSAEVPGFLGKYVRVDASQAFTSGEALQGRTNIGLGNVDNTSDADKPISDATQAALGLKADKSSVDLLTFGQCRLTLSGGNLSLGRFNGRVLTVNGENHIVPSAPVTLSAAGLTPGTLYYIYAYMNSGIMTLEASTTANVLDATTGVQVKTGDASRTFVGLARPVTGPAWVDSPSQRFVLSYFNRLQKVGTKSFSATRTTSSTSITEINSEIRVEFLAFGDEPLSASITGTTFNSLAGARITSAIGVNGVGTLVGGVANAGAAAGTDEGAFTCCGLISPSAGYNYVTLAGKTSAGTASWYGGAVDQAATINLQVKG